MPSMMSDPFGFIQSTTATSEERGTPCPDCRALGICPHKLAAFDAYLRDTGQGHLVEEG